MRDILDDLESKLADELAQRDHEIERLRAALEGDLDRERMADAMAHECARLRTERDFANAEIERLRAALGECINLAVEGWNYASDYATLRLDRDGWDVDKQIAKIRRELELTNE